MPVPQSSKAFIIGKQGSMIKQLQEKTGARIQIPKSDDSKPQVDDDEDSLINITVEGNALSVAEAQKEIDKIASERTPPVNAKLRTIPAEYYPFIAGDSRVSGLEDKGVRVQVPSYHTWTSQPPPRKPARGQTPVFLPAAGDNHISLNGDRAAVQAARAEIELLAKQLERELAIDELNIERSRHQFIIGKPGMKAQEFFAETGCAIILPSDDDEDMITIIGPADRTQVARARAMKLAGEMQSARVDISKQHRNAAGGGTEHARNVAQYLRQRRAIEQLEELHQAHIVAAAAAPWDVYSRSYENASNAKSAINDIITAHPPSRFASINVDPFYHKYLRDGISPVVKKDFGVHVITPPSDADNVVLLVFEGEAGLDPHYEVPRGQPSSDEIRAFQQGLADAQKHILDIISAQAQIKSTSIDVPQM
jgi:rRNA processing protein Krr1/Pno1